MKNGASSRFSSAFSPGRYILLFIIIVISSFSFALGFFVGKHSGSFEEQPLIAFRGEAEFVTAPQEPVDPDEHSVLAPDALSSGSDSAPTRPAPVPERKEKSAHPDSTADARDVATARNKEAENDGSKGQSYSVQIGAFRRSPEASSLKSNLAKKGYNTYIATTKSGSGTMFKVRIGPFRTREEAEKTAASVRRLRGMKPFIVTSR